MSCTRLHNIILSLFAALFIALTTAGLAHASEYGSDPHEHDGVECLVKATADDYSVVLPVVPECRPVILNVGQVIVPTLYTELVYTKPQSRAPPPRAPPTTV